MMGTCRVVGENLTHFVQHCLHCEVSVPPASASPCTADIQESNLCVCWLLGLGFISPFASAQSLELAGSEVLVSAAQAHVNASFTPLSLNTCVGPWYQRVLPLRGSSDRQISGLLHTVAVLQEGEEKAKKGTPPEQST